MNAILFDDPLVRAQLLPLTFTRPVAQVRVGILTIAEKWSLALGLPTSYITSPYLRKKFPLTATDDNLLIQGAICPDPALVDAVKALALHETLLSANHVVLATRSPYTDVSKGERVRCYPHEVTFIDRPWKIFKENGAQLRRDFALITRGRTSAPIDDPYTLVYGKENVFVEENVTLRAAVINAENGPVYLGKNSIVQEGALIRGPFALGEGGHLNMGAQMRGDVSVGPYSKVGGEVVASVIFGNSNKAHDGFLGCSVIGEWCNLGAGTSASNLKNNFNTVKQWDYAGQGLLDTGQSFCGMVMGDFSRSAIHTAFNSGTVVGVSAHVFGAGFPPLHVPSFSWGGAGGLVEYRLDKALEDIDRMFRLKGKEGAGGEGILRDIFAETAGDRRG